ncbi:hypothetical protein GCM10023204_28560 [Actinomycetospora succinea]
MVGRGGCPFDPPAGLRAVHDEGPIAPVTLTNGARTWVVTGYEEARTIFGDTRFSSDRLRHRDALSLAPDEVGTQPVPYVSTPVGEGPGHGIFIMMDPPEHTRLRKLLVGQFTVRRMRALSDQVTRYAVELIDAMRAAGSSADLCTDFALPLPSLVICDLLGVDHADRAEFQERAATTLNLTASDDDRLAAQAGMRAFMTDLVAAKRADPSDDLLSALVHDTEAALTDAELVDVAQVLLTAGHETTAKHARARDVRAARAPRPARRAPGRPDTGRHGRRGAAALPLDPAPRALARRDGGRRRRRHAHRGGRHRAARAVRGQPPRTGPSPGGWTSRASAARTWRSGTGCTSASASSSPASRCASGSPSCSRACPGCGSPCRRTRSRCAPT